jgi:hypothetical protein
MLRARLFSLRHPAAELPWQSPDHRTGDAPRQRDAISLGSVRDRGEQATLCLNTAF